MTIHWHGSLHKAFWSNPATPSVLRAPDIAVIATSASVVQMRNDYLAIAEQFGADAILRKPFTPQALCAAVARCRQDSSAKPAPRRA